MSGTSYAKTRRASVEHWRVMHALSQVDSGREKVHTLSHTHTCYTHGENSAISRSLARAALTQVQCTVKLGKEWGIRGLRSKQKLSKRAQDF